MKRKSLFIIIVGLSLILVACSNKPDKVVSQFISDMKNFDIGAMEDNISPDAGENENLEGLKDSGDSEYVLDYIRQNAKKIKHEIQESDIEGDQAVFRVKFEYVDGGQVIGNTMSKFLGQSFEKAISGIELEEEEVDLMLRDILGQEIQENDEVFIGDMVNIKCIKIQNKWYVEGIGEDLLNVMYSNMISLLKDIGDDFEDLAPTIDGGKDPIKSI